MIAVPVRLSIIIPAHRGTKTIERCLAAVRVATTAAAAPCDVIVAADGVSPGEEPAPLTSDGSTVVYLPERRGPAAARNHGATIATGDVLVFVDSDVVIAPDALGRIADFFVRHPSAAAVFGRYDDTPAEPGVVSQAKNLAHAYVHLTANRSASTFWAGLGAIRRAAFEQVGGFDERFTRPSVEDIELGYRLSAAGHQIVIEPAIQGQHLKRWTLAGALLSDVRDRGVPWTRLLHRYHQLRPDLNLTYRNRVAVGSAVVCLTALTTALWVSSSLWWWTAALCAAGVVVGCDAPLLRYIAGHRGWGCAVRAVPWRIAHHAVSAMSFVIGTTLAAVVDPPREVRAWRLGCVLLALLAATLAARGLREPAMALVGGDESRYAMNGVFLRDAIADGVALKPTGWLRYATAYYTHYPALSLGFHPPLLPLLMVPFVRLLGVGMPAARAPVVCLFVMAVLCLAALVRRTAGSRAGIVAGGLAATNPVLAQYGQTALSEIPALAMMLGALVLVVRFAEHQQRRDLVGFVALTVASVYAKQLAAMLVPVSGLYLLGTLGWRRTVRPDVVLAFAAVALLCVPMVPMTMQLSAPNVAWVATRAARTVGLSPTSVPIRSIGAPVITALRGQFAWPVLAAATAGAVLLLVERRRLAAAWIGWAAAATASVMFLTADVDPSRYGIYLMPPVIAFAAVAVGRPSRSRRLEWIALAAGIGVIVWQGSRVVERPVSSAPGYETAARWVAQHRPEGPVLYSSDVDSGLFVFHVRRLDPERRTVILRADKMLTTYATTRVLGDRVSSESEIADLLRTYGIRFLIVEDRTTQSPAMNLLRVFVRGPSFIERARTAVSASDPRFAGVDLVMYEYRDAGPPNLDAPITMTVSARVPAPSLSLRDLAGVW